MKEVIKKIIIIILTVIIFIGMMFVVPDEIRGKYRGVMYLGVFVIILFMMYVPKGIEKILKVTYKDYISLENTPIEFENIYEDLYKNYICTLEEMRKKVRWRVIIQYILLVFCFIGFMFAKIEYVIISSNIDTIISFVGMLSFVILLALVNKNRKHKEKYEKSYKNEIVSSFIKLVNSKLIYKANGDEEVQVGQNYSKADFDGRKFNRFYSDDYIEGPLDEKIYVKLSDIHVQNVTGSGKSKNTEELFQGIFAFTNCDKNIGTSIKIFKNKLKILNNNNRITMDSEEFEKYFDIYSEDKILTMRLLTSDIMELLIDFYNQYQLDFEIVFKNNTIYLRFFTGAMFEPKIFGNSMDKELLFVYFTILKFIIDITRKVNLVLQEIEI